MKLTSAMLRELKCIERTGGISDPYDWVNAAALWFHARDKVIGALLKRELITYTGDYELTDAGKAALTKSKG